MLQRVRPTLVGSTKRMAAAVGGTHLVRRQRFRRSEFIRFVFFMFYALFPAELFRGYYVSVQPLSGLPVIISPKQ